jgi:hypothetical protein
MTTNVVKTEGVDTVSLKTESVCIHGHETTAGQTALSFKCRFKLCYNQIHASPVNLVHFNCSTLHTGR